MNQAPKKWLAVALSLCANPLGLLYAGAPAYAAFILVLTFLIALLQLMRVGGDTFEPVYTLLLFAIAGASAFLAFRRAARADSTTQRHWSSRWFGMLGLAAAFSVAAMGLRAFLYEPFRIPSSAMEPTLPVGTKIIVQKWGYGHYTSYGVAIGSGAISAPMRRGDIVVFDYPRDPSQTYIKRLVGLPGDRVEYKHGRLAVNGRQTSRQALGDYLHSDLPVVSHRFQETLGTAKYDILHSARGLIVMPDEAFPFKDHCSYAEQEIACTVPPGHYFMMGDNRDNSADSRLWGFVPAKSVIGKVVGIFP